jgi:multiple sugar transport system substrate-binding protein
MHKTIFKIFLLSIILLFMLSGCKKNENNNNAIADNNSKITTIEYWQYHYPSKVKLIDKLIAEFEKENPNIRVIHKTFPYASYQQKVATSFAAGVGPNIINLYYGWVPKYVKAGILQPLPEKDFPAKNIQQEFAPVLSVNEINGKYYTIPIAVRTLGLFWNKDLFKELGMNPEKPPKTLEELLVLAKKGTVRNKRGDLLIEGITWQPTGQLHTWLRPVLFKQFGQEALSKDKRKVIFNTPKGLEAFEWIIDLTKKHKVGENRFYTDNAAAFTSGHAAMHIDASYFIGRVNAFAPDMDYGVTELPTYKGKKVTFASYWTNGITSDTKGKKLDASVKFLKFLTSTKVMKEWTKEIGEIGARLDIIKIDELTNDPKLGPFIKQLPYAISYFYVDEGANKDIFIDAIDEVVLKNTPPKEALNEAAERIQLILDDYWN